MSNRYSVFSNQSGLMPGPRPSSQHTTQVSTTTLLNALHSFYSAGQPYQLDSSTSLVVNTWVTAATTLPDGRNGATIDRDLAIRAWEHARRRAEDGCILLCSLHHSTPSLLEPFLTAVPVATPETAFTALAAIRPFLSAVTSFNPSYSLHSALAATYSLTLHGTVLSFSLALSTSGINVSKGLLHIANEPGYRAFDVFYYLLTSASTPAEREFLDLKELSAYTLLNRSGTYDPPSYLPTADDAAAAEDLRANLKAIGIKGATQRNLLCVLAGLLKLGNAAGLMVDQEELEEVCEDVGGLLGIDPEVLLHRCSTDEREVLIAGVYEALVDWILAKANEAIAAEVQNALEHDSAYNGTGDWANEDNVSLVVVDVPRPVLGKAVAMRGVFDDEMGINAEMKDDGIQIPPIGQSVISEMTSAVSQVEAELGITTSAAFKEREHELDRRRSVLEKVATEFEADSLVRQLLYPVEGEDIVLGNHARFDLSTVLGSSRVWYHISIHPTDDLPAQLANSSTTWSAGAVSRQLRDWRLPEWANRRIKQLDFTADFEIDEFYQRYAPLGCAEGQDGVESWILERGWSNGEAVVGHQRIWMREAPWWEAESMLDRKPEANPANPFGYGASVYEPGFTPDGNPITEASNLLGSQHDLIHPAMVAPSTMGGPKSVAPSMLMAGTNGDYGLGHKGDDNKADIAYYDEYGQYIGDAEYADPRHIEQKQVTPGRRAWIAFVWALTFWMPSPLLKYVGRMKRPDIRLAWREKIVLVFLILLFNAIVYKVWNNKEVGWHANTDTGNDYWVSVHGRVYDLDKFWKLQHSDSDIETSASNMAPLAGSNLDGYFWPPLHIYCPELVKSNIVQMQNNDTSAYAYKLANHQSGPDYSGTSAKLKQDYWYSDTFMPKMKNYYKGELVWSKGTISEQANDYSRYWVIKDQKVWDLTDYFYTAKLMDGYKDYDFFPSAVTALFQDNPGTDITSQWQDSPDFNNAEKCLDIAFYKGKVDFRNSPRCVVNNWLMLSFAILISVVVLVKFLAALQLGSKRRPAPQDKFVICLVPAYTEGEDSLRKGLDSLTALQYDNKRKLIFVICDGMIVGGGNDRPTPKIVLDILGVDPKMDPPALPFKSIGQGSEQLNYAKVYSGLYEYEGNVVPYIVVVKVGKESEQGKSKPGNRGKRDSQVLLMHFLNRVHHRAPMSPMELEIFHQINNIIGVDPELYEYCLMVDADTSVKEDSLNRLVAACAADAKIAGICGETSLQNEERSWWTMIQVYEYYISHHLSKAFESLFGSVTCLPGCFCMYRLRTADRGRPLIISDAVVKEYADINTDTLHKKNLLSLGEDRFLTTLMTKHFPSMRYKFLPDAYASTAAPETWGVLVSQRRRWINSTIHNLVELAALKDLCGFCCFSMRFVVIVDLLGTVILPATCVYLGYLIYRVASHTGPFPLISLVMLAAIYGFQIIIFLLKRQWQHIGWMIIYLMAFPIYSFILPLYSFWKQDDFSWGNTRIVLEEKNGKQVIAVADQGFDPRSIPLQRWDDYALANNLPGRRGDIHSEKAYATGHYTDDQAMEMDEMQSQYSSVRPASTILTGFPGRGPYMPPQSPAPFAGANVPGNRNSHMSSLSRYTDYPQFGGHPAANASRMSVGNLSAAYPDQPFHSSRHSIGLMPSTENLLGSRSRSPLAQYPPRPSSTAFDFSANSPGPDEHAIADAIRSCLAEVDLDTVTKKQVRVLVEQRLQTSLMGEKRQFLDRQIDHELANM
ncbi:Chitin synthase 6 [Penicillium chermesinum]|nr:Chitin synthase 6 [Penicillium chermesinum]